MPLAGQPSLITSSSQISPNSVETSDIVDDAITLAKMAAGTAGNLLTYDAAGDPAAVATGTAGQVLTSNGAGAAPTMQTAPADWVQLGETVLGSAGTTISVASFAARKYLRVVLHALNGVADGELRFTFNSDTGANYAFDGSSDFAASTAEVSQANVDITMSNGAGTGVVFADMDIIQTEATQAKFGMYRCFRSGVAATAAPGMRIYGDFLWANTSALITTILVTNSAGNFPIGSTMTVYGSKD